MSNKPKLSLKRILRAIPGTGGMVCDVAKKCGVTRQTIYVWSVKYPIINEFMKREKEEQLDFAEKILWDNINAGNTAELLFYLKCKGRDRGYIERQEVNMTSKTINLDDKLSDLTDEQLDKFIESIK